MDDCKPAVALRFGTQVGSFSCAAAKRVIPNGKTDGYRFGNKNSSNDCIK